MGNGAGLSELIERELGAFITRIVHGRPEIHGVRPIGDSGAYGIERAGGGE